MHINLSGFNIMLRKADKAWIKATMREVITEALTINVEIVRKRDAKTGVPLKTPVHEKKSVFLPAHWVEFLPFYEQAIIACEVASEQSRNRSGEAKQAALETGEKIDAVGQLYLDLEKPLKVLAAFSDKVQGNQLPTMDEHLKVVYNKDESDSK
jgi:hypothetical protein